MTDQARAWVRTYGTREGSLVALSRLKPYLAGTMGDYLDQGGQRFDQSVVAEVVHNVASYWSRAGWGGFFIKGLKVRIARWGKGAWPRRPEVEHLKKRSYGPIHDLVVTAYGTLVERGIERPSPSKILEMVSEQVGRVIGRSAVRDWSFIESRQLVSALEALPATVAGLARALRFFLPNGKVYVLDLAELASKIWTPSTSESTQRVHRKRVVDMLMRIGVGRVGISVAIVGGRAVIGRQRAIPADFEALAAATAPRSLRIFEVDRYVETQAEQDLTAAKQMIQHVEAFDEMIREKGYHHIEALMESEGLDEDAAVTEFIADHPAKLSVHLTPIDSSIAMTLGVLPRCTFETIVGRVRRHRIPDFERYEAEHHAAYVALRTRHARGMCFGDLFRWAHRRGGQPMAPFARTIAAALTGIRGFDAAHAALPAIGKAGRERTHAVGKVETSKRNSGRIARPVLAAPVRLGTVPLIPLKKIDVADKSRESGYMPTAKEQELIDLGVPWFLAVM